MFIHYYWLCAPQEVAFRGGVRRSPFGAEELPLSRVVDTCKLLLAGVRARRRVVMFNGTFVTNRSVLSQGLAG